MASFQAFGRFAKKWLVRYGVVTWPVIAIALLLIYWLFSSIWSASASWFVLPLVAAIISIGAYRWVQGEFPPTWLTVVAISIPLFMWGLWVVFPELYGDWRGSRYFLWTIAAIVMLAWLSNHKHSPVAKTVKSILVTVLVVAVIVGLYRWFQRPSTADGTMSSFSRSDSSGGLKVTTKFSPWIRVYPGQEVIFDPRDNVSYEAEFNFGKDSTGKERFKTFRYERDPDDDTRRPCERHGRLDQVFKEFRLRVTDDNVLKSTKFDVTVQLWKPGGPCSPEELEKPEPAPVPGKTKT